jgi:hypothetical protein
LPLRCTSGGPDTRPSTAIDFEQRGHGRFTAPHECGAFAEARGSWPQVPASEPASPRPTPKHQSSRSTTTFVEETRGDDEQWIFMSSGIATEAHTPALRNPRDKDACPRFPNARPMTPRRLACTHRSEHRLPFAESVTPRRSACTHRSKHRLPQRETGDPTPVGPCSPKRAPTSLCGIGWSPAGWPALTSGQH